jgi:hypothetical protein
MLPRVSLALDPGYGRLHRTAPWIAPVAPDSGATWRKKIRRSELSHRSAG